MLLSDKQAAVWVTSISPLLMSVFLFLSTCPGTDKVRFGFSGSFYATFTPLAPPDTSPAVSRQETISISIRYIYLSYRENGGGGKETDMFYKWYFVISP